MSPSCRIPVLRERLKRPSVAAAGRVGARDGDPNRLGGAPLAAVLDRLDKATAVLANEATKQAPTMLRRMCQ